MSRCRICAQIATVFAWRTTCGGFQLGGSTAGGGAQSVTVPVRQMCSKRMRCRKVCENLTNALKLVANRQKDGDGPIQSIVTQAFVKETEKALWRA